MDTAALAPLQATFEGTLNGTPASSFRGTVERAGASPYLLLGVAAEGRWLLDVQNIGTEGLALLRLVAVGEDGRRYTGIASAIARRAGEAWSADLPLCGLKGEQGGQLRLQGRLTWRIPPSAERRWVGEMTLRLDGRALPPAPATLEPFNDAWRAVAVFQPEEGQTCVLDLRVPAAGDGAWSGPPLAATLTWARAVDDEISASVWTGVGLEARGASVDPSLSLRFRGALRDPGGATLALLGEFTGRAAGGAANTE